MQITAAVVIQCRPHVEVHPHGTLAQVRADNGTQASRAETWYVPEHEANASHVRRSGSVTWLYLHYPKTSIKNRLQSSQQTNRKAHHRSPNVTARTVQRYNEWLYDRSTDPRIWRRTAKQLNTVRVTCVRIDRSESRWMPRFPTARPDGWLPASQRTIIESSGIWNLVLTTIRRTPHQYLGFHRVELQPVGPHPPTRTR